jgi:hypothetical protein
MVAVSPVDNDDGYPDRFVRRFGAGVARSEAGAVLACGKCDECVIHRSAGNPEPTEHVRETS